MSRPKPGLGSGPETLSGEVCLCVCGVCSISQVVVGSEQEHLDPVLLSNHKKSTALSPGLLLCVTLVLCFCFSFYVSAHLLSNHSHIYWFTFTYTPHVFCVFWFCKYFLFNLLNKSLFWNTNLFFFLPLIWHSSSHSDNIDQDLSSIIYNHFNWLIHSSLFQFY